MSQNSLSLMRIHEYKILSNIELLGSILDVGGSKKSGYHELILGDHTFTVVNLDNECDPDFFVDIEGPFPFEDQKFDNAICLNVLEHVFEFENAFSEQVRCVKNGGKIVIAAPFMYHIHGSPDDFLRYTASAYRRLAKKYGLNVDAIYPLGFGFFSLFSQLLMNAIPSNLLRSVFQKMAVNFDKFFSKISKKYKKLSEKIPLGYVVIYSKK